MRHIALMSLEETSAILQMATLSSSTIIKLSFDRLSWLITIGGSYKPDQTADTMRSLSHTKWLLHNRGHRVVGHLLPITALAIILAKLK